MQSSVTCALSRLCSAASRGELFAKCACYTFPLDAPHVLAENAKTNTVVLQGPHDAIYPGENAIPCMCGPTFDVSCSQPRVEHQVRARIKAGRGRAAVSLPIYPLWERRTSSAVSNSCFVLSEAFPPPPPELHLSIASPWFLGLDERGESSSFPVSEFASNPRNKDTLSSFREPSAPLTSGTAIPAHTFHLLRSHGLWGSHKRVAIV